MTVARFWRAIPQRYNMVGTKCETCGRVFFPPRSVCPACRRNGKIVEHTCIPKGKILTYSVIHSAGDQYADVKPYVLAIIELEEGARLTTHVICEPEEARIGLPVRGVFRVLDREGEDGIIHYGTKFVPDV
jgi:uncharacterized OB-fold protein